MAYAKKMVGEKDRRYMDCGMVTYVGYARAKQAVANHWITHIGHQRRVQKWVAGLVAATQTGDVFL